MKKFAMIARIGRYERNKVIYCTVEDVELVKDSNDLIELEAEARALGTQYREDGKWYSYSVELRRHAKEELRSYSKSW